MGRHVLIVDDSPILRRVVARSLAMAGVELAALYQAGHGQEALEVIAAHPVDLVLADLNMPVMNGVEMVERLSKDGMLKRLQIIVLSSDRSKPRIELLTSLGVSAYLSKPFRPEQLRDVVEQLPRLAEAPT